MTVLGIDYGDRRIVAEQYEVARRWVDLYAGHADGFMEFRVLFGESLAACLPGALSKVFDRVTVVSNTAEAEAGRADAVVLRISNITGHVTPPATRLSHATAHVSFRVELRSKHTKEPLTQEFRAEARSISDSAWPQEVANGAVEAAGNALTQFISANRKGLTGG